MRAVALALAFACLALAVAVPVQEGEMLPHQEGRRQCACVHLPGQGGGFLLTPLRVRGSCLTRVWCASCCRRRIHRGCDGAGGHRGEQGF